MKYTILSIMGSQKIQHSFEIIGIDQVKKFFPQYTETVQLDIFLFLLNILLNVILVVVLFLVGVKLIRLLRTILKKSLCKSNVDQGVIQFIDSCAKIALNTLLVIFLATRFGLTAATVVAVLGSIGLAAGLALQGSLSNFAGGVLILLMKPYKIGDYIIEDTNKNEGIVTEIQVFYTKLATPDNKVIVIPNGMISNNSLTNVTNQINRRVDITLTLSYQSDLQKAKEIMEHILVQEKKRIKNEEINVFVENLALSGIIMGARIWVKTEDYMEVKWRILEKIKLAFDENKIEMPTQAIDFRELKGNK